MRAYKSNHVHKIDKYVRRYKEKRYIPGDEAVAGLVALLVAAGASHQVGH